MTQITCTGNPHTENGRKLNQIEKMLAFEYSTQKADGTSTGAQLTHWYDMKSVQLDIDALKALRAHYKRREKKAV